MTDADMIEAMALVALLNSTAATVDGGEDV